MTAPSPTALRRGLLAVTLLLTCFWFGRTLLNRTEEVSRSSAPTKTEVAEKTVPTPAAIIPQASPPDSVEPVASEEVPVFERFTQWSNEYLQAVTPEEKSALFSRGHALAAERRVELKKLIRNDPETALTKSVPFAVRERLPLAVRELLEEQVHRKGMLGVIAVLPEPGKEAEMKPIHRMADLDGKFYNAHVFGKRLKDVTRQNISIHGIAVDRELAVSDSPMRVLEKGEKPDPAKAQADLRCPVSKKPAGYDQAPEDNEPDIIAESGDTVYYLCSNGHIEVLAAQVDEKERVIAQDGGTGGGTRPLGYTNTRRTIGPNRMLYIRVTFATQQGNPQSEANVYDMMATVNNFYMNGSYGKTCLIPTVTPLLVLPQSEQWYKDQTGYDGAYQLLDDARAAAKEAGYDTDDYEFDTVRYNGGPGTFQGLAYIGWKGTWLRTSDATVAIHEYGHNYGLFHANYWVPTTPDPIGPGTNDEYGNIFSKMGAATSGGKDFTSYEKNRLSWLPTSSTHTVTQSGTYRIYQFDQPILDATRKYALSVNKDGDRVYWGEFRQLFTAGTQNAKDGLLLNWDSWKDSNNGSHLIDTTYASVNGQNDSAVVIGRTFSDKDSGIHFTPIGKNGTSPESLDVVVNLGHFPLNQPPSVTVSANQISVPVATPIQFTATASDPNSDPLGYAWSFGNGTYSVDNLGVQTRTFSTAGEYFVRCEVSDMKGGVRSDGILVTVGAPATFSVTGRVLDSTGQPIAGVRLKDGVKETLSDSQGDYALTGLTAGSKTIVAYLNGYTFASQVVTVGPSVSGLNFMATDKVRVSIAAIDATATEASVQTGTLRLTRTGATTSALSVLISMPTTVTYSGEARYLTDFTLSPVPTISATVYYTITIPAGSASLDLTLTPADDTSAEGPEDATITVFPRDTYVVGQSQATVRIDDNDTALPTIVITPATLEKAENESTPSQITVTRLGGSTASALTVSITKGGAATSGSDYSAIPSSVTIPAGASSTSINFTPINDTAIEGYENATFAVASNAAYRVGTPSVATATIFDDDQPTVTVTASDATGAEGGGNNGAFTITRAGSSSASLTVDFTLRGTAEHGIDYAPMANSVTIPAGAASVVVPIVVLEDQIGEPLQDVILMLASTNRYLTGSPLSATVSIADNDKPTINIAPAGNATEGGSTGSFSIYRNGAQGGTLTVNYTVSGTATSGSDFTAVSGSISIPANSSDVQVGTLNVVPLSDGIVEDVESVVVTLSPSANYTIEFEPSALIQLFDTGRPVVSVAKISTSAPSEAGTAAQFYFSRNSSVGALDVHYSLAGTATNGVDYVNPGSVFTIPNGSLAGMLTLTMVNDTLAEGAESIELTIEPDAAYSRGLSSSAFSFITDNDSLSRTVGFASASGSGSESGGSRNVSIVLSASSSAPVSVYCGIDGGTATANGVDYQFTPQRLTFAPGETSKTVQIGIESDTFTEGSETVKLLLRDAAGAGIGISTYTHTIQDSVSVPNPELNFVLATSAVDEGAGSTQIAVAPGGVPSGPISAEFYRHAGSASDGVDYSVTYGMLSWPAGDNSPRYISVSVANDSAQEGNENVEIRLRNPTGGAVIGTGSSHILTIQDNDASVTRREANGDILLGDDYVPYLGTVGQDGQGGTPTNISVSADDRSATLTGNVWKIFPLSYTVAAGTVLEVTIQGSDVGEIVGITLDNNNDPSTGRRGFLLGGTDAANTAHNTMSWNLTPAYAANSAPATYVIPVGNYFTGTVSYLGLIGDDDANASTNVTFSDIRLYTNQPPVVTAGVDQSIAVTQTATLLGSVSDDGLPDAATSTWSKQSGPGNVTFGNAAAPNTTATFSLTGTYVLRLTATDSILSNFDDLEVTVTNGGHGNVIEVDFNALPPGSYNGAQDGTGTVTIEDAGKTLHLAGNRWQKINLPYTITANTLIDFDLEVISSGELAGIGFDNDDNYQTSRTIFKVAGSDACPAEWHNFSGLYYNHGGGLDSMVVPVGRFYTGAMTTLAFVADADAAANSNIRFTNVRVFEGVLVDFDDYTVSSYAVGQDGQNGLPTSAAKSAGGLQITLAGNAWKRIPSAYNVTANTVLEFQVESTDTGEIIAIGFDNDNDYANATRVFQLAGSDVWAGAFQQANTYEGGKELFRIDVGQFFTGTMNYLVLIGDDDSNGSTSVVFKNIRIYEK